jgi:predicted ABC-class ATPase
MRPYAKLNRKARALAKGAPAVRHAMIEEAHQCLLRARDLLAAAGTPYTLARVRLALSSIKGARRNSGLAAVIDRMGL